jgi:uncharacterized protein YodC (DUF2158 family)
MATELQVGDVVILNSGGPHMTVVKVDGTTKWLVLLNWTDKTDRGQSVLLPTSCVRFISRGSFV